MIETGADERDLAAAAINARARGARNPRALRRTPLSEAQYFESPYVAEPYRVADCTVEVDGACAILVTSLARARDLALPPAIIQAGGWQSHRFDLDMASFLTYDDFSRSYAYHLRDRLWSQAGLSPADIQVACLYDCFTGVLLQNVEGFGLAEIGGGGDYLRRQAADPTLPVVNPSGGLLAEGYLHGMNLLAEAVWQVQGAAGPTQVENCRAALACSGGALSGSAVVLVADAQSQAR